MIEIYQLRQLIAISECGSLSKAAEQLQLSQPALSRTMKRLEEIIGVSLFERSKNKVALNENGKIAVEYARKVLDDANLLVECVRAFDVSQRTISLCACAPSPLWVLVPILSELYPEMKISSEMKYHDDYESELLNGKCHILITPGIIEDNRICTVKLFEEQLYLSVPHAHPLSNCAEVSLKDLDGETMLLLSDLGYWGKVQSCMKKTRFIMLQEQESMTELVKISELPAFSSSLFILNDRDENRVLIPISDDEAKTPFYCCWRKTDCTRFKELEEYLKRKTLYNLSF